MSTDDDKPKRGKKEKPKTAEQASAEAEMAAPAVKDYQEYVDARAADLWSHRDTGHNLTVEEQLFCRSYIIDRNPVAALNRLRYAGTTHTLKQRAKKLLANPEVQGAIEAMSKELMAKLSVTAEKVQQRIAAVAFFDPREVMSFDGLTLNLLHSKYWTLEQAQAIQGIKMGQNGVEIKLYDGLRAAEMLAKQLGVQPDDFDPAEAARAGAEATVTKLFELLERTHEGPKQLDGPGETIQ